VTLSCRNPAGKFTRAKSVTLSGFFFSTAISPVADQSGEIFANRAIFEGGTWEVSVFPACPGKQVRLRERVIFDLTVEDATGEGHELTLTHP
jgi:hypothetical protein